MNSMSSTRLYYTEEGVPYYFDHATGTSQWALPTDWSASVHPAGAYGFASAAGAHAYVNSVTGEVSSPAMYAEPGSSPDREMPAQYQQHARTGAPRLLALPHSPQRMPRAASMPRGLTMSALGSSEYHASDVDGVHMLAGIGGTFSREEQLMPSYVMESPTAATIAASSESAAVFAHARAVAASHSASMSKRERRRRAEKNIMDARRAHYPYGMDGAATAAQAMTASAAAAAAAAADGYLTVHDSPSSMDGPRSPERDLFTFLGFRSRPKLVLPMGATAPSAPLATTAAASSTASAVDAESLRAPPSPADDAAHAFIGMTLQERTDWLRGILSKFGDTVVSQAQLLTVYLASQSLPFLSSFIETTLTGSVREARRVVRNVARAAHRALSPRGGELPLTMPRRHRSCPDADAHTRGAAAASYAAADVSHYTDTEAYFTAAGSPDGYQRAHAPGQLVEALFSPAVVESYLMPDGAVVSAASSVSVVEPTAILTAADIFGAPASELLPHQQPDGLAPAWGDNGARAAAAVFGTAFAVGADQTHDSSAAAVPT